MGGEKQRVNIGRALILDPDVLLADEPVSMLDVSTQASILNLLARITSEEDISMLYISHDVSTVAHVSDEINVMYLGRFVESAPTKKLLSDAKHPYSQALTDAIRPPTPHQSLADLQIDGVVPAHSGAIEGCRFKDRCPERMEICENTPDTVAVDGDHSVACHLCYDHQARGGGD